MSPAEVVAKLAADVAAASSATQAPSNPAPRTTSVVGKAIHIECGRGHHVEWRGARGYKHMTAEDCGDRSYRPIVQAGVSSAAREAYRAMRKIQREEANAHKTGKKSGKPGVPLERRPAADR